ncbi:MAG: hypothetical protein PUJ57_01345 [Peptoniphilaceae bacterium]|nr:hypothetical protein [Peptoniphilaceae bacterium]MDY6085940.1 hypothetical protein [Peptoniphilaceae bacterium]
MMEEKGQSNLTIATTMLFGKLGPLTMLHALVPRGEQRLSRLAEEKILVG